MITTFIKIRPHPKRLRHFAWICAMIIVGSLSCKSSGVATPMTGSYGYGNGAWGVCELLVPPNDGAATSAILARAIEVNGLRAPLFFRGLSGAPVQAGETLIGAVAGTIGITVDNLMRIMPLMPNWAAYAHVATIDGEAGRLVEVAVPHRPGPGDVVCALEAWGGLSVGQSGRITAVDGAAAALLGHPYNDLAVGPCLVPLFDAATIGVCEFDRDDFVELVNPGEIIGVMVYSGAQGCVGIIGLRPSITTVKWRIETKDGICMDSRCISIVSGRQSGNSSLSLITAQLRIALDAFITCPLTIAVETRLGGGALAHDSPIDRETLDPASVDGWVEQLVERIGQHGAVDIAISIHIVANHPLKSGEASTK